MPTTDRCSICGFHAPSVPPSDAAVALRSFPRRYRGAVAAALPDDDPDAADGLARRAGPSGWSAIDYIGHLTDVLDAMAEAVRRGDVEDDPAVAWPAEEPPSWTSQTSLEGALDRLATASDGAATVVERTSHDAWSRPVRREGETEDVSVLDVARSAVHEGSHHLRELDATLDAVRADRA